MADQLDWHDPAACASWLGALTAAAHDVIAVAEDQTAPIAQRDLGRRAARANLAEASHSVESLVAFARSGLADDDDPPSGDPAGYGGAGPVA